MSARNRFQQPQQEAYRASLEWPEVIKGQIVKCGEMFNEHNVEGEHATVENLRTQLSTPMFSDDAFDQDMEDLAEEWEDELEGRKKKYEEEVSEANGGCPDLVESVSLQPGEEYWRKMYSACLGLCERRGLLIPLKKEQTQ